jgi:hypothetical protein
MHNISCVVLSVAQQLCSLGVYDVVSKGVERILLSKDIREQQSLSLKALCTLCNFALDSHKVCILDSIKNIAIQCSLSDDDILRVFDENITGLRTSIQSSTFNIQFTRGSHGRMIRTTAGFGRGHSSTSIFLP